MNLNIIQKYIIFFSIVFVFITVARAQTEVYDVPFIDLILNPEKYDSKYIRVIGFLRHDSEGAILYAHGEAFVKHKTGILLLASEKEIYPEFKSIYVLIEGTFDANKWYLSSFGGAIKDIKRIEYILPKNVKGYEIYGFIKQNKLYFTLLIGTNGLKTFEEIDSEEYFREDCITIKVEGIEEIKNLLKNIPGNSDIIISCPKGAITVDQKTIPIDVTCPSPNIFTEIEEYIKKLNENIKIAPKAY